MVENETLILSLANSFVIFLSRNVPEKIDKYAESQGIICNTIYKLIQFYETFEIL